jgi:hypothetical protein
MRTLDPTGTTYERLERGGDRVTASHIAEVDAEHEVQTRRID